MFKCQNVFRPSFYSAVYLNIRRLHKTRFHWFLDSPQKRVVHFLHLLDVLCLRQTFLNICKDLKVNPVCSACLQSWPIWCPCYPAASKTTSAVMGEIPSKTAEMQHTGWIILALPLVSCLFVCSARVPPNIQQCMFNFLSPGCAAPVATTTHWEKKPQCFSSGSGLPLVWRDPRSLAECTSSINISWNARRRSKRHSAVVLLWFHGGNI